jgi:excinuclease ABC subunit B
MAVAPVNSVALSDQLDEAKFISFPDSPYQLYQLFQPAGDQPTAIAQLVEGINDGLFFQTLLGVTAQVRRTRWRMSSKNGVRRLYLHRIKPWQLYSEFRSFFRAMQVEYFVLLRLLSA